MEMCYFFIIYKEWPRILIVYQRENFNRHCNDEILFAMGMNVGRKKKERRN